MKKRFMILTSLLAAAMLIGCSSGTDPKKDTENVSASESVNMDEKLTDEQALSAIRNYCYAENPDLKDMEESGDYTIYWDISSGDEKEVVVLYRSYTGAEIRYYIDRSSGDTYVTEFVSGITEEEERTEENFNVKDYDFINTYEVTDADLSEKYFEEGKQVTIVRYYEIADGTWKTDDHTYKYKLEISGRKSPKDA